MLRAIFNDGADRLGFKIVALALIVAAANVAAWLAAAAVFGGNPVLMGTALLAYGFGLRHAVDADHIAAIDNVTRKLMQEGKRPVSVGFFFSLGHSTIVVLASLAIAFAASNVKLLAFGNSAGTLISATFLLAIAIANLVILASVYRTYRRVQAGEPYTEDGMGAVLAGGGFLSKIFGPVFRLIRSSWQMYLLGFLFALGFDTATEIGVLGISATQGSNGLMLWSILLFPALFAAGMSLIDTADGVLMLGAYGWAFLKPLRKLAYNMTITLISAAVALVVGGIEVLGLIDRSRFDFGALSGTMGYLIVAVLIATWIGSWLIWRMRRAAEEA